MELKYAGIEEEVISNSLINFYTQMVVSVDTLIFSSPG
jgi:hypothetical protein